MLQCGSRERIAEHSIIILQTGMKGKKMSGQNRNHQSALATSFRIFKDFYFRHLACIWSQYTNIGTMNQFVVFQRG